MDSDFVLVAPLASVTWAVKAEVPAEFGVPEMTPVEGFSDNPGGKVLGEIDHTYDNLPPVATSVWLYAVPVVPNASALVAMLGGL